MGDEDSKTEELTSGESLLVTSSVGRERKSVRGKTREEKRCAKVRLSILSLGASSCKSYLTPAMAALIHS